MIVMTSGLTDVGWPVVRVQSNVWDLQEKLKYSKTYIKRPPKGERKIWSLKTGVLLNKDWSYIPGNNIKPIEMLHIQLGSY